MKKDLAVALVLVAAGVAVTAACSSSSKDENTTGGGGGQGGTGAPGGTGGAGGALPDGGVCSAALDPCTQHGQCCGFASGENVCVDTGDPTLGSICLNTCAAGTECESGCCAELEGGGGVCGPEEFCAPGDGGGGCAPDLEPCMQNSDCCGFASGQNVCIDTGPSGIGVACLVICEANTDCRSNCCTALDGTSRVCAPATECQ